MMMRRGFRSSRDTLSLLLASGLLVSASSSSSRIVTWSSSTSLSHPAKLCFGRASSRHWPPHSARPFRLRGGSSSSSTGERCEGRGASEAGAAAAAPGAGDPPPTGSIMGRPEYWDQVYEREMANLEEIGDPGDAWFDEAGSAERVSRWMAEKGAGLGPGKINLDTAKVIDVGTGNGQMLVELAQAGFRHLTGTDYLDSAIALARKNVERAGFKVSGGGCGGSSSSGGGSSSSGSSGSGIGSDSRIGGDHGAGGQEDGDVGHFIQLFTDDCLSSRLCDSSYDVWHDKGTLDAIYLGVKDGPEKYVQACSRAVCTGGVCVITSCNYTREELVALMTSSGPWWSHIGSLEYDEISYGGGTGSTVVSESFRRKVVTPSRS